MLIAQKAINSPSFYKINLNVTKKHPTSHRMLFPLFKSYSNAFASCANCSSVRASPLTVSDSPQLTKACSISSLEK